MADAVARIRDMLADTRAERRYAAAIVLAELKAKDPPTVKALTEAIGGEDRRLCRYAIEALAEARAVAGKTVSTIVPLLVDPDPEVRRAAEVYLAQAGESATAALQKELQDGKPEMRRAAASVLAKLGGRTGLDALIDAIDGSDTNLLDRTRAALARAVPTLGGREAQDLADKLQARCKELLKRGDAEGAGTALRALGEIKDADVLSFLKAHAGPRLPGPVRRGALSALARPIAEGKGGKRRDAVVEELLGYLAEDSYEDVVRPALGALHSAAVPAELTGALVKLLDAPQPAARQLAIRKLGEIGSAAAARALVNVLSSGDQVAKASAREAIAKLPQAAPLLVGALLEAATAEEARMIASMLRPRAAELSKGDRNRLAEGALDSLESGVPRVEALTEIARHACGAILCDAAVDRARKLRRKGNLKGSVAMMRAVSTLPGFDDAARFELGVMGLSGATGPVVRVARSTDPVLGPFVTLLQTGFPLPAKLAKEKSIGDEELFFLGFAFAESNDDTERELGCEVLGIVADRSPRSKLGRSAKNKIRLMEGSS